VLIFLFADLQTALLSALVAHLKINKFYANQLVTSQRTRTFSSHKFRKPQKIGVCGGAVG
jgi:hypothetical protein